MPYRTIRIVSVGTRALAIVSTIVALHLVTATAALALPVTYVMTGYGSGTVDGQPFADAAFTLSFTGDTADVAFDGSVYTNELPTAPVTLAISGYATASMSEAIGVFSNSTFGIVGFTRFEGGGDLFAGPIGGIFGHDLATAIGPIAFSGGVLSSSQGGFQTSLGWVEFTSYQQPRTWETSLVPEPSTALLLGIALAQLSAASRTRRTHNRGARPGA